HQAHALAAPALLQLRRELHLPVAARRRLHLAMVGLEPAPDEPPPVGRRRRRLTPERAGLRRRPGGQGSAVPVPGVADRGLAVLRAAPGEAAAPALERRGHDRSSSASPAPWNSRLWLSRCCW